MQGSRILDRIYAAHRFLSELEGVPRDYGTGEELFATEIHTIVAIGAAPGANLTALADALGVSKAAASKFVAKLARRGYVRKYQAEGNRRDVLFEVTRKGSLAADGHDKFERKTFGPLLKAEKSLSPAEFAAVEAYFEKLLAVAR